MCGEEGVREALAGLEERVSIAGMNAPEGVVISGYEEEVGIAEERLKKAGVRVQRLVVSHGFHSPQMAEMEEEFERVAEKIEYAAPKVKLISSVTGREVGHGEIDGKYWRKQVREPVRFQKAMETLRELGQQEYVEVGAGTTLVGLGRQCQESGNEKERESGKAERLWAVTIRKGRESGSRYWKVWGGCMSVERK
jgi:acyl transferase domain-containing protein